MRKLLLATAAILGASGGLALAQTAANPTQGELDAPYGVGPSYNNPNNSFGNAEGTSGSAAAGGLSSYGRTGYPHPAPGTLIIRFGGKVEADVTAGFSPAYSYGGNKVSNLSIGSYMRLYPGFDGMSSNGIRYGAQIELRENWGAQSTGSPSGNTSTQTVFVRRSYTYLATNQVGIVRLGQGDGVIGLFDNCIFTSQCFDAGVGVQQGALYTSAPTTALTGGGGVYPWLAQAGAEYGNNKIVYLTPQLFGFDLGVQFAPGEGNSFADSAGGAACSVSTPGGADNCNGTTSGGNSSKWYNQAGIGLRFDQNFGPMNVKAYGFYEHAAHEDLNGGAYTTPGTAAASNTTLRYQDLNFYQTGVAITTAGLTGAVTYIGGKVNGQLGLVPDGGADMSAIIGGLTYLNGPWTLGGNLGVIDNQGQASLAGISQRHSVVAAIGGNYKLAPGVQLVLEYEYIQQHQGDFNFITGANGAANNTAKAQGVTFSTMLTW